MAYEKYLASVQALCSRLHVSNDPKIEEHVVKISGIAFLLGGKVIATIDGGESNLASRLWLQEKFSSPSFRAEDVRLYESFKKEAKKFFGELWGDFGPDKRPLLYALSRCDRIKIFWKEPL